MDQLVVQRAFTQDMFYVSISIHNLRFQLILFQVFELFAEYLERNVSGLRFPLRVDELTPGAQYRVVVYASNSKGRSEEVQLEAITLNVAEKQMGKI